MGDTERQREKERERERERESNNDNTLKRMEEIHHNAISKLVLQIIV
jgi:hypothetical protein